MTGFTLNAGEIDIFIGGVALNALGIFFLCFTQPVKGSSMGCILPGLVHFDVTGFLKPPSCNDCLQLKVLEWDNVQNEILLSATLRNPTNLDVYDVRLILDPKENGYWIGDPVTELTDGYTKYWDVWGDSRNPFSAFAKEEPDRVFQGQATNLGLYDINNDNIPEILAPTYDNKLNPHLNVYSYDSEIKKFKLLSN